MKLTNNASQEQLTHAATLNESDGLCSQTVMWQGSEWQRCDDREFYTWEGAIAYCQNLVLAGHSDWRLPTKDELKSLVVCSNGKSTPLADWDYSDNKTYGQNLLDATCCTDSCNNFTRPTIDPQFQCSSNHYWSSSAYDADHAWGVYFGRGDAHRYYRYYSNTSHYVRCIR